MNKKESSGTIKSIIISLVICGLIVASLIACFLFLPENPAKPPENNPPVTPPPTPPAPTITAPENITVKLLDNSKSFEYSVTNIGEYSDSVIIENASVATLENNVIKPKAVGTTKIIVSVNCTPAVTKETTLTVIDCISEVNLSITNVNGVTPERYYTNTKYILKLQQNIIEDNKPFINVNNNNNLPKLIANNIENINYLKTENNCYYYEFNIISYGNFSFEYKGEYVSANIQNSALNYPTNFSLNFENNLLNNSNINLYLFNEDYLSDANQNNVYNKANFTIQKFENSYDEITASSSNNNIVTITDNQIIAKTEGSAQVTFKSLISNYEIKVNVTVCNINLERLIINGVSKNLNETLNVTLNLNEEYNLNFTPSPIYSICNLSVSYNENEVDFSNGKIKLLNNVTSSIIYIKNEETTIYTINFSLASNLTLTATLLYPTSTQIINNTLTISKNVYAQIKCNISDLNYPENNVPFGEYKLTYDKSYISLLDPNITAGSIALEFLEVGITQILITNITHNVSMVLTVIIV